MDKSVSDLLNSEEERVLKKLASNKKKRTVFLTGLSLALHDRTQSNEIKQEIEAGVESEGVIRIVLAIKLNKSRDPEGF